ncbi:MAG: PTS sugar transporter subunit IIA [Alphaproteobacteria bacterium]|nr:PTS sugar transporter subunit IIA [Alphaproteobacteria bacterium]
MPENSRIDLVHPRIRPKTAHQIFDGFAEELSALSDCSNHFLKQVFSAPETNFRASLHEGTALVDLQIHGPRRSVIALATLEEPLDFMPLAEGSADIVCFILSPQTDGAVHLRTLSRLSRLLKNTDFCENIRKMPDAETIRMLAANPEGWLLAA